MPENKYIKTNEKQAAYKLININGIGSQSAVKLIDYARTAERALNVSEPEAREILGIKTAEAFLKGREQRNNVLIEELEKEKDFRFVPLTSEEYPEKLRHIPNPPFALYVRGELPPQNKPAVAVVGARACSEYGKSMASYFGSRFGALQIPVISGMARGIDGIAQKGALDGGGRTYGVLGCGVDVCYPQENETLYYNIIANGGIISEYPPGTEAQSALFPQRNRIISGLSDIILVIEARRRSGTYITVTQALEQGKEIYALPGRITDCLSEGCNFLITQGAGVAINPDVIIEDIKERQKYYDAEIHIYTKKELYIGREQKDRQVKNVQNIEVSGITSKNAGINQKNGRIGRITGVQGMILKTMDITPLDTEYIYSRVRANCEITMEEVLLELTRLQMMGLVTATGNYYRLTYAL